MRPKRIVVALVALVALAVTVVLLTRPATRFIYASSPLDADSAVLLTRHNGDDETRFFAQVVRTDGSVEWDSEITPFRTEDNLGFLGVVADADRIYLLGSIDEVASVMALDRRTGEHKWQVPLRRAATLHRIAPSLFVEGDRLIVAHSLDSAEGGREGLTAFATADGTRVWPANDQDYILEAPVEVLNIAPGRLAVSQWVRGPDGALADGGFELDTSTGQTIRSLPMGWGGCLTSRGLVAFGLRTTSFFPRTATGPGAPQLVADAATWRHGGREAPCGLYGNLLIMGMRPGHTRADPDNLWLVAFDLGPIDTPATDLQPRWSTPIEGFVTFEEMSAHGELPRFLPVVGVVANPLASHRVAIVDLETGQVVQEAEQHEHPVTLVAGRRAFIHQRFVSVLAPIEPTRGDLAAPISLGKTYPDEVREEDIRFGRLWLHGSDWAGPGDLPWAVLDLGTLSVLHSQGGFVSGPSAAPGSIRSHPK